MVEKLFCECQLYARGDSKSAYFCSETNPEAQIFCTAHLAEGRAFPCPYDVSKLQLGDVFGNGEERLFYFSK